MEAVKYFLPHNLNEEVVSLINDNSIITITDALGRIEFATDKYCDAIQCKSFRVIGETHKLLRSRLHTGAIYKALWRTIKMGQQWNGILSETLHDGSIVYLDTTIIPLENDIDKNTKYLALYNDVTKLHKQKDELLEIKTETESFLESLPYNVFIITKHGKILNVNKSFCSISRAELLGTYLYDHVELPTFDFFKKNIDFAFSTKNINQFETYKFDRKSKKRFYKVTVAPIFNELGGMFSATITIQEIVKNIMIECSEEE